MEVEVGGAARDRRLDKLVAATVLGLTVFVTFCKIKDDNIVQAMQVAKADAVDTWNEYQATRLKLHLGESGLGQLGFIAAGRGLDAREVEGERARLQQAVDKYRTESDQLRAKAQGLEGQYDALNYRDDQFDLSDALVSIALALAATAALTELYWLPACAWVAGGLGVLMEVAGFTAWPIHPDALVTFLT